VLREGGRITTVGIGIGLLLALGTGKILQGFLHGVDAVEPIVLVTAPLILLASSLLVSYIPALRATKVDPNSGASLGVTVAFTRCRSGVADCPFLRPGSCGGGGEVGARSIGRKP